jgi:N-formylglutamate amidohydrolase
MDAAPWTVTTGISPLVATAIHNGHDLRPEVAELSALAVDARLREEDPYTGRFTVVAPTQIVVHRSRFEVDLNRPRERAVYRGPDDAWGLHIWQDEIPIEMVDRSLDLYDAFYAMLADLLDATVAAHGHFVLFDMHSYNHRRNGPDAPPAPEEENPEVNVGTGTLDRTRWGGLVDRFISDLRDCDMSGRRIDVRENVRFRGGHLSRWIHERYPATGCALAIEFKKVFMDEWTGEPFSDVVDALVAGVAATVPGILEGLASR